MSVRVTGYCYHYFRLIEQHDYPYKCLYGASHCNENTWQENDNRNLSLRHTKHLPALFKIAFLWAVSIITVQDDEE